MTKGKLSNLTGAAETLLLACGLVFAQGVGYAQERKADPALEQTGGSEPAPEKSSTDGAHQGIKIHGHWTIEVHDPDGTLVTHREFENAYVPGTTLASVLARQATIQSWEVALDGSPGPCQQSFGGSQACAIVEPSLSGVTFPGVSFDSFNLMLAQSSGTLVLSGSVTQNIQPAIINQVQSGFVGAGGVFTPFTRATLVPGSSTPPIIVQIGQTVQVTVAISFS